MGTFSVPLSGLQASSSNLNSIGNNLANLNTDGYKNQTLTFGDIFAQAQGASGNGDPIQIGSGVQTSGTFFNYANGNISSTGVAPNMALQGNGFFIVKGNGETSYTRNGDFSVNSAGQLATTDGKLVMGYAAVNGVVSTSGQLSAISVNQASTIPAAATSSFQVTTNLDSASAVGATFNTPLTVYDSLGTAQTLNIQYTNTAPNTWSYSITLPASATGAAAPTTVGSGTLAFDSSGKLTAPAGTVTGLNITGLADGAAAMNLTWKLNGSGTTPTITQQNLASATTATFQDGYAAGTLTGYSVLPDGTVEGQFTNDKTLALGQVAVANFANVQGLAQTGGGNEQATTASGAAVIGVAGSGGNGTITGGAVEQSNVDLSTEFTNMIVAQQSYEANAKVLTALDEVSRATIQLIS